MVGTGGRGGIIGRSLKRPVWTEGKWIKGKLARNEIGKKLTVAKSCRSW